MNYEIFSDSSCNLTDEMIDSLNLNIVSLYYVANGEEHVGYVKGRDNNAELKEFYNKLRDKQAISTSCVNEMGFIDAFEPTLQAGKDLIYLGFSSGLSATYNNAANAIKELTEKYPERKIIGVDTLCASMGQGLLVYKACEMRDKGATIDELASWVEDNKLNLGHWFTVDDLYWLFKGGRVSATSYALGSALKIKPVLHVDNEGKLVPIGKVMGRKKSISEIANHIITNIKDDGENVIFISHGDCIEDVEALKKKIDDKIKVKEYVVNYIDTVISAHSGPGTLAVFCMAKNR